MATSIFTTEQRNNARRHVHLQTTGMGCVTFASYCCKMSCPFFPLEDCECIHIGMELSRCGEASVMYDVY